MSNQGTNEEPRDYLNEAGDIGEEQLPQTQVRKSDKFEWTYASDENSDDITVWQKIQKYFRGGT
jgi:hypothetical protein